MAFSLVALLVVVADQLTKTWIRSHLALGQAIPPTGFWQIVHARNTGAVFGLFPNQSFVLTIVALIGIVLILVFALFYLRQFSYINNLSCRLALGLILGGTIGNLIDRIRLGYVTDFINIGIWPAFNIADSAVTVGALTLAYYLLHWAFTEKEHG